MPGPGGSGRPLRVTTKATRKALALQLGILSDEEILKMSVVEVNNEQILDRYRLPAQNGLHDPRMGTTDMDSVCGTCGCSYIECPGHFGHIRLAQPVYHPGYITNIIKVLRCICHKCSRIRASSLRHDGTADKTERDKIRKISDGGLRFRKVLDICQKIKSCQMEGEVGCGEIQPTYRTGCLKIEKQDNSNRDDHGGIGQADARAGFRPEDARAIFERIPDEDLKLMGLDPVHSRPEWMIIKVLTVAPPPVRPSVQAGDGVRSEDDLTFAYREIVKNNILLTKYMNDGHTRDTQDEILSLLQIHVATFMNNNISDAPKQKHLGGRAIRDIRSRLKGKEGRVRGNLMGKRVDFSARTVITPDPILALDQLGVPKLIAINLTVPEYVTKENMEVMKQLVANGTTRWPGAKFIIRHDGQFIDLSQRKNKTDIDLSPGYIVERHLRDDDYVIFNRQPSLHKMSLMGHRVKVLPFQTFRLNLSVTSPYNADFDGDEMNMHVPQSLETKAEIKEIMHVPRQIVAPKHNQPVMGIVQDSLLGIYLFTQKDNFLTKDLLMNLMMWMDFDGTMPEPAILKPKPLWTGKQILSLIFPKVNFRKGNDKSKGMDCEKDLNVLVKNGELICGMMNKGVVGASQGGLIHIIWRDCGPFATRDFMSQVQNIVNNWLSTNGFTIGVQDIIANQSTLDKIQGELIEHKQAVQEIIKSARAGKLEKVTGMGMLDSFEFRVNQKLKQALDVSGRLALADLAPYNRLKNMVTAGSKGGEFNISQIMACVGQQNVTGKRIPFGFNRRSLPHFSKDDFGPESKGFVFSSYFLGLTPQEFYFHAMGGREGLIDTAVKTADTGYIQRRLIKALEDVQVKYDQTVRTSRDQIIQFLYGEDGMAGELIENQNLPLLDWNNKELEKKYQFFPQNADDKEKKHIMDQFIETATPEDNQEDLSNQLARISEALDQEYAQIYKDRGVLRSVIKGDLPDDKVWLPVNLNRLLWNAREKYDIKVGQKTNLTPEYIIDRVKWLTDSAIQVYRESRMKNPIIRTANDDATLLIKIFLRHKLASKVLIQDNKTRQSQESFEWLIGEIEDRFRNSMVHPGEMVGSIGAQSLGEPATQMTLNTFHSAGVGAKNVTLGVPRLREVINVATTLKTPSLKIQLKDPYKKDEKVVSQVGNEITTVTLLDVVTSTSVYYDPDPTKTIIKADEALVRNFEQNNFLDENELAGLSSWILRIEIDTQKLQGKYLSLEKIEQVLRDRIPSLESCSLNIIRNIDAENLERAVIRLRLPEELIEADEMQTTPQKLGEMEKVLVNEMTLRGIPMITKFTYYKMMTQNSCFYDEETGDQIKRKNDFCIETDGVNLKQVLNVDRIEYQTVMSNSIREILTVLGVEATRKSILSELRFVLGAYGIYVNYRHLGTLCDIMTNRGVLTAITRHGINRIDSGALRKCSFEETVEILLEASFHAELDPLSGVTENIIMGQLAPYGTGSFDIMMDTDMIQKVSADHKEATDIVPDIPQDFEKVFDEGGMTPIVASPNMQDVGDGMSTYGQSDYGGFTPIASDSGGQSLYFANSPGQPMMACPQSPSAARPPAAYGQTPGGPMMGGAYAGAGGGSPSYGYGGQSPATQGYGMAYASQSPAYQGQRGPAQGMQFGNQGMSPRYAMSPSRPMGGGTTPGYSGGYMPQASMSPAYMQSPGYSPTGNPAMSPTAYVTPDEPVYGKKEESKKN